VICKQEGFEVGILDLSCATSEFEMSERGACVGAGHDCLPVAMKSAYSQRISRVLKRTR
jgi:hypothetical protein